MRRALNVHEMSDNTRILSTLLRDTPPSCVQHSKEWWLGATMSTLVPVVYAFTGGMRASLVTDAGQARVTRVVATALARLVLAWQVRDDRCNTLHILILHLFSRCRW